MCIALGSWMKSYFGGCRTVPSYKLRRSVWTDTMTTRGWTRGVPFGRMTRDVIILSLTTFEQCDGYVRPGTHSRCERLACRRQKTYLSGPGFNVRKKQKLPS